MTDPALIALLLLGSQQIPPTYGTNYGGGQASGGFGAPVGGANGNAGSSPHPMGGALPTQDEGAAPFPGMAPSPFALPPPRRPNRPLV